MVVESIIVIRGQRSRTKPETITHYKSRNLKHTKTSRNQLKTIFYNIFYFSFIFAWGMGVSPARFFSALVDN